MNVSALGGYGGGPEPVTSMDIDREKSKIARFLSTKERCGLRFLEREAKAEARLKQIDARTLDFEKRKKLDQKIVAQKLKEKQEEAEEKKNKVEQRNKELEAKSVQDYRKLVVATKRQLNQDLKPEALRITKNKAKEVLQAKYDQIQRLNQTFQAEDTRNRMETIRTLETVEAKVKYHDDQAKLHKANII